MKNQKPTIAEFDRACHNLSLFMFRKAEQIYRHTGISYDVVTAGQCPENGKQIKAVFEQCRKACKPFPVYDGGSENTIYDSPAANHAFRFWHDYLHYAHNLTIKAADELKAAELHREGVAAVFGADSLEARIMFADVAGQVLYYANTGKFVDNQRGFIFQCVTEGGF